MSDAAVQAAVKRATIQAHRAMNKLDAEVLRELRQLYLLAATDLRVRIAAAGQADGNIVLTQLQDVLDQVNERLRTLAAARNALLENGLENAAGFGTAPLTAAGAGAQSSAMLSSAAAMRVADEALRITRTFVAADGLQLSDRIWRLDRHAREVVANAIEMAVIQGHGAVQAARELLMRGQAVPVELANKMNAADSARIGNAVAGILTGNGSPMDNAMRLMRTEINRAHGEAYIAGALDHPDAAGVRFLLSPAYPEPDICYLHATANLYGLGPGVYPNREKCPWPAHPNTLSYVEVVFKDEITDTDRAGKETLEQALARLTPEQRKGVLGVDKAKAFNAGKLKIYTRQDKIQSVKQTSNRFRPDRSPWHDFSPVLIHAEEKTVKKNTFYNNAKSGDIVSAEQLVRSTYNSHLMSQMAEMLGDIKPIVTAISAIEEAGENVIPTALAGIIAQHLNLTLDNDIVQINRVSHTGAKGDYRLATPALFDGPIQSGASYLLVDDFVGQGGTLANLRGFIEKYGGRVVLATTLTGKAHSAKLALSSETLKRLREKHGNDLENWWKDRFGYGFEFLTESEARYLERIEDADKVRDRIVAAEQTGQ